MSSDSRGRLNGVSSALAGVLISVAPLRELRELGRAALRKDQAHRATETRLITFLKYSVIAMADGVEVGFHGLNLASGRLSATRFRWQSVSEMLAI